MSAEILVAHESETIGESIRRLLAGVGWGVHLVRDGHAARAALDRRPAALVLDVALPGLYAYELVDELRRRELAARVVLVASIYNRTGYKRRPTSLYGADDYVEQHHIPDSLVGKLERLIGPPPGHGAQAIDDGERIRQAGEARLGQPEGEAMVTPQMIARAERLARLIVADVALYNGDALAEEPAEELEARLRLDLEEGRLLFDLRIPEAVRRARDFIGEALTELRRGERNKGAG